MINLHLQFHPRAKTIDPKGVGAVVKQLNQRLGVGVQGTINVRVTSAGEVKRLNQRYGNKAEATDVLSFSYLERPGPLSSGELGDIVISRQHLLAQAKQAGSDQATELALLVLHGVLHVLGYDHQTQNERHQSEGLQRQIMRSAGLVYRDFNWSET